MLQLISILRQRPETADAITHLVSRLQFRKGLRASERHLRILDLCTGSGCMSLLLHESIRKTFRKVSTSTVGVDISPKALALARANLKHVGFTTRIQFKHADILSTDHSNPASIDNVLKGSSFDIIVANPPYISTSAFYKETARSVRNYEPRLALVPNPGTAPTNHPSPAENPHLGDTFYPRLASIANSTNTSLILMEVGSMTQAKRIVAHFASLTTLSPSGQVVPAWHAIEIWCDGILAEGAQTRRIHRSGLFHIPIVGPKEITHGRTVVCWRNEAMYWLHTDCYIDGYWHQDEKVYVPWAFPVGSDFRTFSPGSGDKPAEWFNHVREVSKIRNRKVETSTDEEVYASPHYSQKSLAERKP